MKEIEGLAFGDVVVITGFREFAQKLEDLGRGRAIPLSVYAK